VLAVHRFDLAAAERVRAFFRRFLRHSNGRWAGEPFEFLDWQWREVVGPLFGWKRPDGTRRFRRGLVELPKKNGKSTLFDRWNATQLAVQLEGDGFEVVATGQGYASLSAPTKKLEELVLSRRLAHGGHPVLRWMAGNVSLETDAADNWKPSKKKSGDRIDGVVALVMALDRAACRDRRSKYETEGLLWVGD
jgi:phage terminase large subunit-like protein